MHSVASKARRWCGPLRTGVRCGKAYRIVELTTIPPVRDAGRQLVLIHGSDFAQGVAESRRLTIHLPKRNTYRAGQCQAGIFILFMPTIEVSPKVFSSIIEQQPCSSDKGEMSPTA